MAIDQARLLMSQCQITMMPLVSLIDPESYVYYKDGTEWKYTDCISEIPRRIADFQRTRKDRQVNDEKLCRP